MVESFEGDIVAVGEGDETQAQTVFVGDSGGVGYASSGGCSFDRTASGAPPFIAVDWDVLNVAVVTGIG